MRYHTIIWFKNRIGKKLCQYKSKEFLKIFELTKDNYIPFYFSQKDFGYRYEVLETEINNKQKK